MRAALKPLVIYHANCIDGFAAAWTMREDLMREGCDAEFLPHQYGQPFDVEQSKGRVVYILDYSFKRPVMEQIRDLSAKLIVIDHHKTAQAEVAGLALREGDLLRFDMEKSGASLTWSYCFGGEIPPLIRYVEDRDLWRFKYPETEAIMDCVASYPYMWVAYGDLFKRCSTTAGRDELIREGKAIGRYKAQQVATSVSQAREIELDGHKVLAVNMSVANLLSQIAGELSKGRPFGLAYFQAKEGHWVYSLRSQDDGIDVSELAKMHGGGGHKHAAGFQSDGLLI